MSYQERKNQRREQYLRQQLSVTRPCVACSGSGRYDSNGSPACGACDGTGLEQETLKSALQGLPYYREYAERCERAPEWDRSSHREAKRWRRLIARIDEKKALAEKILQVRPLPRGVL